MNNQQTKQERKRLKREAVIAQQIQDAEMDRHFRIIRAATVAGIPLKQIQDGLIQIHFRGEKGDEVSFQKARGTNYTILYEAGAFDGDYSHTVNAFFGAWRAQQIALGQWGGRLGEKDGETPPADQARLFTELTIRVEPAHITNMKILASDLEHGVDIERVRNYLLPHSREYALTLVLMETLIPELQILLGGING